MSSPSPADRALAEAVQLHQRGDLGGAIRLYKKAVRKQPGHAAALNLLGLASSQAGELEAAASYLREALALKPDLPDAHFNLGVILYRLGKDEEAADSLKKAIARNPGDAEARSTLGAVLTKLGYPAEAADLCRQAIGLRPDFPAAYVNLGNALLAMHHAVDAISQYERALYLNSRLAEAHIGLSGALLAIDRHDKALRHAELALSLAPDNADAHMSLANVLVELGRKDDAVPHLRRTLSLDPANRFAFGALAGVLQSLCDWSEIDEIRDQLRLEVEEGKAQIEPLMMLSYFDDPALHLRCARKTIASFRFDRLPAAEPHSLRSRERIRVAYLSSDMRRHATSHLAAELFALHDREQFEIIGISTGTDDRSDMRSRVALSFDQFHDVCFRSDEEVAALVRALGTDILVDLNGHTSHARFGVLARRPAPIQAAYLGYPGTTGADFIDYVIGDPVVLPMDHQSYYSEKIVQLPDSYQVNDRQRKISATIPTRKDVGLPDGFVFCCFNKSDKISPEIFDVWMRLLKRVDGSVLWLIADEATRRNLRTEAAARGVDPGSLVFASRIPTEDHLARHVLANLFLDTLPYNAHTTASDALWAGLPVLTCTGHAFAGRVATSLLRACGLPKLVTASLDEYEALAVRLAAEPGLLAEMRARLEQNRSTVALFDTPRFCRNLESAYRTMVDLSIRGELPRGFAVGA